MAVWLSLHVLRLFGVKLLDRLMEPFVNCVDAVATDVVMLVEDPSNELLVNAIISETNVSDKDLVSFKSISTDPALSSFLSHFLPFAFRPVL